MSKLDVRRDEFASDECDNHNGPTNSILDDQRKESFILGWDAAVKELQPVINTATICIYRTSPHEPEGDELFANLKEALERIK